MASLPEDALEYHRSGRPGKIEVNATKAFITQRDLSLAYTPGVAEPCRQIYQDPERAYDYTIKGNLVAVATNGTAVLGLGNIGPLAGKPVMEGKAVLFKRFADIDVFDLEINATDPDQFISTIKSLEPTFGGINLEDIKAPDSFYIEETLKKQMKIPVFHDDQHGTAIITGAALLNALKVAEKPIETVKIVYCGAGAAAIACAKLHVTLGINPNNLIMCDRKGVIYEGRKEDMNPYKALFASPTKARTLEEALEGADVFIGLSVKGALSVSMLQSMAKNPIVFALANPDPEIEYNTAINTRSDVILATGRSDYPNQVNNVLGFPFIFRGALDVRATDINEAMKIAAVNALVKLSQEDVPHTVLRAYGLETLSFGRTYLIPKPFDHRVLFWVAPAVAQAAIETGVARKMLDLDTYKESLEQRMGMSREIIRHSIQKAKTNPKRIVFPEGDHPKILSACQILIEEGIAHPILIGSQTKIQQKIAELGLNLPDILIIDPATSPNLEAYTQELFKLRQRKGITLNQAKQSILNHNIFSLLMLHLGDADGFVAGVSQAYPDTIRSALQIIGTKPDVNHASGVYLMLFKHHVYFFADTTVNIEPSAETLADIAIESATLAKRLDIIPRIAMLSFSNFGSVKHPICDRVRQAVKLVKTRQPDLIIDGEMQADTAVNPILVKEHYPFSEIKGNANILIFPDLQSGNIAYKLLHELGGAEAIGPILLGMRKSVHILQRGCQINTIVNMAAIAVLDAQELNTY
ncbi:NADP-dependent malic enzyme [Crocosphaera sp. XPORK-15E]|uniref:NADP-dependent malic enzyme n=1 Tax=Crocosphaera sp. XPORK-15E TaxID=3110247 RepID=UPI002B20A92E|nr:NADP-dependent malic enzyme [Crocosphaera sp. XPORK-15E]MEA5534809.1 NADP-dependent malic enzyme [Crocosphaera sp. XPORK-15E]